MRVWESVAQGVRAHIAAGDWAYGARLPTTAKLAQRYSTSRATVAQALAQVGREGLISYAGAHHGWHVSQPTRRRRLARDRLSKAARAENRGGFLHDAQEAGAQPDVTTVVTTEQPPPDIAGLLGITTDHVVVIRDRIQRMNDHVAQLATGYIPADIAAGTAIEQEDPGSGGILQRLTELGFAPVLHEELVVPARTATGAESELLNLADGAQIAQITRVTWAEGRAVLVERIVCRPQEVELHYSIPAE